jgi:hypothetical protein
MSRAPFRQWGSASGCATSYSFSSGASLGDKAISRQTDTLLRECSKRNRRGSSPRLASRRGAHVQPRPQKKAARAYRIKGSIVLYRSAARSQFKAERSLLRAEPWWRMVFGAALFLRTLFRLVFVCRHRHKSPPITLREAIPSILPGCRSAYGRGTYVTCLDCGQKFAYNQMTRRLVDFWGVHDAEALAGVRRKVDGFFSPLRDLAAGAGSLNMRIPMSELVRSVHRLAILTKGQWIKSQRLIASKWVSRSDLKQTQTQPENN